MAYTSIIGLVMIGTQVVITYLATQFKGNDLFGKVLQNFFLLGAILMIPLNIGIMNSMLVLEGITDADLLSLMDMAYNVSTWFTIVFIAILMLKFLYTSLIMPLKNLEHNPDSAIKNESVIR